MNFNILFIEPRNIRKYPCGLVDFNIAGIIGLFGNEML